MSHYYTHKIYIADDIFTHYIRIWRSRTT